MISRVTGPTEFRKVSLWASKHIVDRSRVTKSQIKYRMRYATETADLNCETIRLTFATEDQMTTQVWFMQTKGVWRVYRVRINDAAATEVF